MKLSLPGLWLMILLPAMSAGQSFLLPEETSLSDRQILREKLSAQSELLQAFQSRDPAELSLSDEQALRLVNQQLTRWNDPGLYRLYDQLSTKAQVKAGLVLYTLMGGISGLPAGYSSRLEPGAGLGFYLMYATGSILLMPQLFLLSQGFTEKANGWKQVTRLTQLALALTALYVAEIGNLRLVFGASPQAGYALDGRYKLNDGDSRSLDFGGSQGARRLLLTMGLTSGILFRNDIMLRAMYGYGLTPIYKGTDQKLNFLSVVLNLPFQLFRH